ncbi:hypothetical protein VTJ83DRAFT_2878 [Remersonia thermophila]|uniref:Hemerythrin-like domain-containing protein n=1 Tax=Remersonia thermophila TaxID=72144 RepID=A0ABR4DCL3_9PEZI
MSTISDVVTKDHRELESYYNEIINSNDPDHQERFGNQFTWELARHSVAEELIVYPAMEKLLGDRGHKMAEDDRKEHHRVKELLKEFQPLRASSPEYMPKLRELWGALSAHIEEEERSDLPALEAALSQGQGIGSGAGAEDSAAVARTFERTKMFVPTRSHPSAGENPYFESAMGLLAAPVDRLMDIFRKFPEQPASASAGPK